MASSAPVISPNDFETFRLSLFVRKYGKKVVHLIYTFHFLHGQHRSIREILTDNQVPLQGRRCPFNDQDIINLTVKLPEDLDFTLMNKICQALWQRGVNDPGDELKGLLKKIKDEMKFVIHDEIQMSEEELEGKLRDFQATLEETLDKIKSLFPSLGPDTDQLKAEVQDAVPKLLEKIREKYDPSNPQDVQLSLLEVFCKMASSAPVISPNDFKTFRMSLFVRKYGKKVVHLIYTFHFLHGQHRSIREILTDNQVPLQGRKCPFNDQDIRNLTDRPPEDLDITLMNKICQALWQRGMNDPGDELKGLLKKIKDERNIVSHEETQMSEEELEDKLRGFQATLEETLDKIMSLFPSHFHDTLRLKAEIHDVVPKLLGKIREQYDPSSPQDVQRFKEEIGDFRSEVYEMIQESSAKELRSLNERLCQILPYDWLADHDTTDPGQIMVPLQVADDQELNRGPSGRKSIIANQKEIFNIKNPIGKDPDVVIISGDAGSGKTTILSSYAEGWCKNTNDVPELSSFPFLFYIQFRNHDHDNFDDYIKYLMPHTTALFPFDLVKLVVLGSKCLVLCDGYDEANKNSRKLFQEFLKLNSNEMKFVVTTRPGNTEELTNIVNKAKRSRINLKVLGLQEEDMISLTEKLIDHLLKDVTQKEQMKTELLQKIKKMNTGTRAFLQTPLYFNLFVLLYIECPDLRDEMSTRTLVYLQLRRHKIKRISDRTGISEESLEEFDELYRKWCLKHYLERKYEYSESDVESFKREISSAEALQNFDAIMSSYFSIEKRKKDLDIVKVYCHRDRSEQGFAAAGSICDNIITSSRRTQGGNIVGDVLQLRGFWDRSDELQLSEILREVISFIPGILYNTERAILRNIIGEIHELFMSPYSHPDKDDDDDDCVTHDDLLLPSIETRLDDGVLGSLASLMEGTVLNEGLRFRKTDSLLAVPALLSKFKPRKIEFGRVPRDLSELNETLQITDKEGIHTSFELQMDLNDYAELSGVVYRSVDYLDLAIFSDRHQDLQRLRPLSLMHIANLLRVTYHMLDAAEDRIAEVINRTIPTHRVEGTTDLVINVYGECDVRLLLRLLTVRPLRSITIVLHTGVKIDIDDDLRRHCRDLGLGELNVVSSEGSTLSSSDESETMEKSREGERQSKSKQEEEEISTSTTSMS